MNEALIGLGSNIDPTKNVRGALRLLRKEFGRITSSRSMRTKPVGYTDQPDFINKTVLLRTHLSLPRIKKLLKRIEVKLGRAKSGTRYGPRTIDLDVIVFNGKVVDQDFYKRRFLQKLTLQLMPKLKSTIFP